MNTFALLSFGQTAEALLRRGCYFLLLMGSLVGAAGLSLLFKSAELVTVGFSGSLFGLLGLLAVLAMRTSGRLERRAWASLFGGIVPLVLVNFIGGLLASRVDNWAHAGGFAVRALAGLSCQIVKRERLYLQSRFTFMVVTIFMPLLISVLGAARVARHENKTTSVESSLSKTYFPPPPPRRTIDFHTRQLAGLARAAEQGFIDCLQYSLIGILEFDACQGLKKAVERGRTDPAGRQAMRNFLKGRGINRIYGWVVALVEDNTYEVAWMRYDYDWGISVPSGRHFLLKTVGTRFTTTGTFTMWVERVGSESVMTKSGKIEEWQVYRESIIGEAYQDIIRAPAGEATSEAARTFLVAVTKIAFVARVLEMQYTEEELAGL